MSWLALVFALELGMLPSGALAMYQPSPYIAANLGGYLYTDLEARVEILEVLYVGGGVRTQVREVEGSYAYYPTDAWYRFEAGLAWRGVELFWRHYCIHPVVPWLGIQEPVAIWEGAYTELGIRLSGRVPLWRKEK